MAFLHDKNNSRLLLLVFLLSLPVLAQEVIFTDGFENPPPQFISSPILSGKVGEAYDYDVDAMDFEGDTLLYLLTISPEGMDINGLSGVISWMPEAEGVFQVTVEVSDPGGDVNTQSWSITVEAGEDSDSDGLANYVEGLLGTDPDDPDSDDDDLKDGDEVYTHATNPLDSDSDNDDLTDGNEVNTQGTDPNKVDTDGDKFGDGLELEVGTDPLNPNDFPAGPPDPQAIAPPTDPTVVTLPSNSTEFIHTGVNPIQTGMDTDVIVPKQAAVIRGKVMTRDGTALPDVVISIYKHPEFGQTLSRADGRFDMVVNGGGPLVIDYRKDGFLSVQRRLAVGWQQWSYAPDVALIGLDPVVTTVNLSTLTEIEVASGSMESDIDGSRQAQVLFRPGTTAEMVMADGSIQALTTLNVRATEYTVGPNGPQAMPGDLPLTTGYTYAVELSVDEALAADASSVQFSQGVPFYVDNFLGFAVGGTVPIGFYDRSSAQWVAEPNGRVLGVIDITNGLADIDADGDELADTPEQLADLGIDAAEREQMAALYAAGDTFWRVVVTHFSPFDCNWPYAPPADANEVRNTREAEQQQEEDKVVDPCFENSSIIECQNQLLGEQIGLVGTPYTLNYRSDRALGDPTKVIDIPVTGATVSSSLILAKVIVQVAGRTTVQSFSSAPNQSFHFEWDGIDAYGRRAFGTQTAEISIVYLYPLVYTSPEDKYTSWARAGSSDLAGITRESTTATLTKKYSVPLRMPIPGWGLAGWTLGVHHFYDPVARTIHLGSGGERKANSLGRTMETFAGGLDNGENYDTYPIPRLNTEVDYAPGMGFDNDGSLYYVDQGHRAVFKIDPEGIVHRFAGTGEYCGDLPVACGAGGPALDARFNFLTDLAVAPDGTVYILDDHFDTYVYAVGPDGILRHVAGWGDGDNCVSFETCALEGPATEGFIIPWGIDVGPDGALYLADLGGALTIGRVDPKGIISTVAGTTSDSDWDEARNCALDGTLSIHACMVPLDVAVGPDGTIFVLDELLDDTNDKGFLRDVTRVLAFGADGVMRVIFDERSVDPTLFFRSYHLAVDLRGRVYIGDEGGATAVYMIDPLTTEVVAIAGTGLQDECLPCAADGGAALDTPLRGLKGIAVGPDGDVYINDYTRIKRIGDAMPKFDEFGYQIASEDGDLLFIFANDGRHLSTVSTLTGAMMLEFGYDGNGLLSTVTDGVGKITMIERDGQGNPQAVVGHFGHRSVLVSDSNDNLASVTNPAGERISFRYRNGQLIKLTNAAGGVSEYRYDSAGRLARAQDPAGGVQTLVRSQTEDSFTVTRLSPGGKTYIYRVDQLPGEIIKRTDIDPLGAETVILYEPNGLKTTTYPNGEIVAVQAGGVPRFGLQTEYASSETFIAPSGLQTDVIRSRTTTLTDPGDPFSMTSQVDQVDINGRVFTSELDVASLTYTSTSPEGLVKTEQYDSLGRLMRMIAVAGVSAKQKSYGEFGLVSRTTFGPQSLDFIYDTSGNLVSKTNALNETTQFEYDEVNRYTALILPSGRRYEYGYDALGNRTSVKMPSGEIHRLDYTVLGQESTYLPPGSPEPLSSEYDNDRGYAASEHPSGRRVSYLKDAQGRAAGFSYPEAEIAITYLDATSDRVASVTRTPTGGGTVETLSFTFDGSIIDSYAMSGTANGTFTFGYDNNMFLTGITFDADPELPIVSNLDGAVTGFGPFEISLNAIGMPGNITDGTMSVDLDFNTEAKVIQRTHNVGLNQVYDLALTYDAAGQVTNKVETVANITHSYAYGYDPDGQLIEVKEDDVIVESYTYDENGNRSLRAVRGSSEAATYDVQDRITGQGALVYELDVDGFLTDRGADTFSYSARGELLTASVQGVGTIDYAYDALNRQIGRSGPDGTTQYFYGDPHNAVSVTAVRQPDGTLTNYYYDSEGLLYALQRGADRFYVATDQVGSPRVVVDDIGTLVKTIEYDAWGVILYDSNPAFRLHVGFAGGIADPDTALVRFGMRDYDPLSGRWTARDPVLFQGGQANLYVYVANDPINFRDPTGLVGFCIGGSFYNKFGGGAEFCFDENGTSLCLETGFGGGGSTPYIKPGGMKDLDHGGRDGIEGGIDISCGPVKLGVKLKLDDCGVFSFNCPTQMGSFGPDTCAGMKNSGDGWTGPTKEGVTGSLKKPGVMDALKKWNGALPDYTPPPSRKPSGTRVADPECNISATIKGTFCGRHKW